MAERQPVLQAAFYRWPQVSTKAHAANSGVTRRYTCAA